MKFVDDCSRPRLAALTQIRGATFGDFDLVVLIRSNSLAPRKIPRFNLSCLYVVIARFLLKTLSRVQESYQLLHLSCNIVHSRNFKIN